MLIYILSWTGFLIFDLAFSSSPLNMHLKHFSTLHVLNILDAKFASCYCPCNLPHHFRNSTWECFRQQVAESVVDIVSLKWNGLNPSVRKSLSQHTQNNYIRRFGTLRDGERDEGSRDGGMGTNRWINELSGEKGICAFIVPPPAPHPFPLLLDGRVLCCKCSPRFPSASLPLRSSPNRNGSLALNM